jgi:hypothetical protein
MRRATRTVVAPGSAYRQVAACRLHVAIATDRRHIARMPADRRRSAPPCSRHVVLQSGVATAIPGCGCVESRGPEVTDMSDQATGVRVAYTWSKDLARGIAVVRFRRPY